jgi:hypothetical protein
VVTTGNLHPLEQFRQAGLQSLANLFDICKRQVPYPAFNPRIIRPMQAATLSRLLLIYPLLLPDTPDSATKPDFASSGMPSSAFDCSRPSGSPNQGSRLAPLSRGFPAIRGSFPRSSEVSAEYPLCSTALPGNAYRKTTFKHRV